MAEDFEYCQTIVSYPLLVGPILSDGSYDLVVLSFLEDDIYDIMILFYFMGVLYYVIPKTTHL